DDFVVGAGLSFEGSRRRRQVGGGVTGRQEDRNAGQSSAYGAEGAAFEVVGIQIPVADHRATPHLALVLEHEPDVAAVRVEPSLEIETDVIATNVCARR